MSKQEQRATSRIESSAQAETDRLQRRMGATLMRAEVVFDRLFESEVELLRISVKVPTQQGEDYLAVVTAYENGSRVVGFHGAATFAECVEGCLNRLTNRSMKFRPDQYAAE